MPARLSEKLEALALWALARPRVVVSGIVLLVALAAPGLLRIRLDNSPEAFFLRDAAALEVYDRFEFDFGRDRAVRLVFEGEGLWSREGLVWLGELEERARGIRGVVAAAGLSGHHRWHLTEWPPEDPGAFRQAVLEDPLDQRTGWVSADGRITTVLVAFYKIPPEVQRKALADLEELLVGEPAGIRGSVAGLAVVERALDEAILDMVRIFFPALGILSFLLLWAVHRRLVDALRPLVFVTVCQVVVFGAFGWSGSHLDLVTSILVPLLFVVALATAVHVQMRFLAERAAGGDAREALRRTVRAKAWPVFWTGATTALGFGSLAVARLPAIRSLGLGSAFAFAFMTLAALTLLPVLLGLGAGRTPARSTGRHRRSDRRWGKRGAELAIRFRRWTFIAFGGVAALALGGTFRLGEEGGILEYFRPQHPVRTQLRQLEAAGMDVVTAELVLTAQGSFFEREESLHRLRELSRRLEALPRVSGAFGAGDLVAATVASLPSSPGLESGLEAIRAIPDIDQMLRYFLARQGSRTRITLRLPMEDSGVLDPILAAARAEAVATFPEAAVEVTGRYPLVLAARRSLSTTMVLSLGLTLLAVAGVFRWLLGSSALTLRVLLPNLWPVAVVLGAMGWGGVALDPTTVIVAAAILGLAVDDTFHTLGSFRQGLASCDPPAAAVRSLDELAGAHALSSLVLAAGFGACAFSSFVPVGRFGALAVLGVAASLAGDLWLVPALLSGLSRRELSGLRRADDGGA